MATQIIYECKCCGGDVEETSRGLGKCTSCRKVQSIPLTADLEMINRANRLRKKAIFDEAMDLYGRAIAETPDEPEAYWGLVLCRYGIEYVEDTDGKALPTCHRTIEKTVKSDPDFVKACENANDELKAYYMEQAELIDSIQRKILDVVKNEKPFDIFISYKSHDEDGNMTVDSKYAQKIFNMYDRKGYNVFFAEETLKKYAGTEYEPHIYAALKSAKVMILIGGSQDYLESAWVKNEWSRYQDMMKSDSKKGLIFVHFDIEEFEYPSELVGVTDVDWKTADAINVLNTHVDRFLDHKAEKKHAEALSKAIKDSDLESATEECETAYKIYMAGNKKEATRIIDNLIKKHPAYARAYWIRMLIRLGVTADNVKNLRYEMDTDPDYVSATFNANDEEKKEFTNTRDICHKNVEYQISYEAEYKEFVDSYLNFTADTPGMNKVNSLGQQVAACLENKMFRPRIYYKNHIQKLFIGGAFMLTNLGYLISIFAEGFGKFIMLLGYLVAIGYALFSFLKTKSSKGSVIVITILTLIGLSMVGTKDMFLAIFSVLISISMIVMGLVMILVTFNSRNKDQKVVKDGAEGDRIVSEYENAMKELAYEFDENLHEFNEQKIRGRVHENADFDIKTTDEVGKKYVAVMETLKGNILQAKSPEEKKQPANRPVKQQPVKK